MKHKMLFAASLLALCSSAQAAMLVDSKTYYLDQSNVLPDGFGYVTVAMSQWDNGDIDFAVTPTTAFIPGDNFGIQAFGFNPSIAITGANIFNLNASWTIGSGNLDGFGSFAVTENGDGKSRMNPLTFTIRADGDNLSTYANPSSGEAGSWMGDGKPYFAAHVAGFITSDPMVTSAYFAGNTDKYVPPNAVPVPAAAWLLGSGLLGLIGAGARKRK